MFVEALLVVSGVVYMFAALAVLIASAGKVRIAQKSRSIAAMTTLAWLLPLHYLLIGRKKQGTIWWSFVLVAYVVDIAVTYYGGDFRPWPLAVWWIVEAIRTPKRTRAWNDRIDPTNTDPLPQLYKH